MLESTLAPVQTLDPARAPARAPARTASIMSVATDLPPGRLTSAEIADRLGITEQWILARTGIRERRRAAADERLTDYATRAGAEALARAGVDAEELDLVIVGTMTQDELTPNTAPLVAHALGATRAGAFDIGAACTAFLSGLSMGAAQIETGRADKVLLIGADFITRLVNYDDRSTAPLFADAAGAAVLGVSENGRGGIGPIILGADGVGAPMLVADHHDRMLRMDGHGVFKHAVARMTQVTLEAVAAAGLTLDQIDVFVFHQANARITRAIGEQLGITSERVVDCIESFGNASAATLPVALVVAEEEGRLQPGARVLVSAFGAGFTWGGGVLEWAGSDGG